jgi:FkbH-like protein
MPTISIAANFTIEPIENALKFWLGELSWSADLHFAPYNQIFQQLLDSSSIFFQNKRGLNVVFIRLQDWINSGAEDAEGLEAARRNLRELEDALLSAATRASSPFLVCFCPSSPTLSSAQRIAIEGLEQDAVVIFNKSAGLYGITSKEIAALYPVEDYADPQSEILGHIPYTPAFYAALASITARRMYAIQNKPYKVIVLDCDQTLWKGVVGEDGPLGVEISAPYQALQAFMVAQHQAGMLLCLCSKNQEADVFAVFDRRPEMKLQRNHLVSWRINWMSKSQNIQSLAAELKLGLDSFILVDDNPLECAEVQANCPEVVTAQIPSNPDNIPMFLSHFWAFDRLKVTQEDLQRTAFYQQDMQRERLRQQATTFSDFLANLGLQIEIGDMQSRQLDRVSQLTSRTNQFNATTVRRSASEIGQLLQSGEYQCLTVQVKDRFGDYGLVGVTVFRVNIPTLQVDTFLLSCRALGRGVEHALLAKLGKLAQQHGCAVVEVTYIPTERNQPFFNFIESVGAQYGKHSADHRIYELPAEYAAALVYAPAPGEIVEVPQEDKSAAPVSGRAANTGLLQRIADTLNNAGQILNMIETRRRRSRSTFNLPSYLAPRAPTEKQLAELWAGVLALDMVGIEDNFFDLGGGSLLAAQLLAQINKDFNLHLPIQSIFEAPTVALFARHVETLHWMAQPSVGMSEAREDNREEGEV